MTPRRLLALLAPALCLGAAPPEDFDPMCRNGLFPSDPPFALAQVSGSGQRAQFHDDSDGCPWEGEDCATRAYVVSGDTVIVSRIRNGFACTFYPSRGGGTAGWVKTAQLALTPLDPRTRPDRWIGAWTSEGNPRLRFADNLGGLKVTGEAYWPGPEGTHDYPSTHVGEIDGPVTITGSSGKYGEDENECEVRFTLLGNYLVASDNRNCGGANVSFSAVYTRAR